MKYIDESSKGVKLEEEMDEKRRKWFENLNNHFDERRVRILV